MPIDEVELCDREHLIRLRIALQVLRGVIPFGTLADANLQAATRPIAEWAMDIEAALDDQTSPIWDGWIPVARRLPEEGITVLIAYTVTRDREPWPGRTVGHYDDPEGWWDRMVVGDGMRMTETVTHWCPLPDAPGESESLMSDAEVTLSKIRGSLMAGGFAGAGGFATIPTESEAVDIVARLVLERNTTLWRSVGHELPCNGVRVMVIEGGQVMFGILRTDGWNVAGRHGPAVGEITMWRPVVAVPAA